MSLRSAHHGDKKSATGEGMKIVGNRRERRIRRGAKLRGARVRNVEEKHFVLSLQHAEKPAAGDRLSIRGETYMMKLVSHRIWPGYGRFRQNPSVTRRLFIKVDHRQKVRGGSCLVPRTDEEI